MNVFIIGSPLETAQALDKRRLIKQIAECKQILDALNGDTKAWAHHPAVLQYEKHAGWLCWYKMVLECYIDGCETLARIYSRQCDEIRPSFHTEDFFDQMKRRLYTKDPVHYAQWASLGTSEENWYWSPSEGKIIKYVNGKRQD